MKKNTKTEIDTVAPRLREASFKIRGLAHLLKNQREHSVTTVSTEEAYFGIGDILDALGRRVRRLAEEV